MSDRTNPSSDTPSGPDYGPIDESEPFRACWARRMDPELVAKWREELSAAYYHQLDEGGGIAGRPGERSDTAGEILAAAHDCRAIAAALRETHTMTRESTSGPTETVLGLFATQPAGHLDTVAERLELLGPWEWTPGQPMPPKPWATVAGEVMIPLDVDRDTGAALAMLAQACGMERVEDLLHALIADALTGFRAGRCFDHLRAFRDRHCAPLEWAPGSRPEDDRPAPPAEPGDGEEPPEVEP